MGEQVEPEAYEDDEDEAVCADGYPEHDTRDTYNGPDGTAWECRRCGAEGWESAEEED